MASRAEYQRKWREANPDYNKGKLKLTQRHCKECNVEIGKGKRRCPECKIIRVRAQARAKYKYTPEMATRLKKWREANLDKCKEYGQRAKQREWDKKGPKLCHRCNIEIERKYHSLCRPCYSIHAKEQSKRHNYEQTEYRKQRYENRDKEEYNAYAREYQRGTKFREYQKEYHKNRMKNEIGYRERIYGYQNKYFKKRYHTDIEFREKHLAIRRHRYRTTKKSWYQLRLERIEKLKGYLDNIKMGKIV